MQILAQNGHSGIGLACVRYLFLTWFSLTASDYSRMPSIQPNPRAPLRCNCTKLHVTCHRDGSARSPWPRRGCSPRRCRCTAPQRPSKAGTGMIGGRGCTRQNENKTKHTRTRQKQNKAQEKRKKTKQHKKQRRPGQDKNKNKVDQTRTRQKQERGGKHRRTVDGQSVDGRRTEQQMTSVHSSEAHVLVDKAWEGPRGEGEGRERTVLSKTIVSDGWVKKIVAW